MPIDNSKYTLLLVHSTFEKPEIISKILLDAGFKIKGSKDFREALRIISTTPPDLAIIDMTHAKEEEIRMIEKLKNRHHSICSIPILFIVSVNHENSIPGYLSYDNIDFINSPYHSQELVIRIRHQLLLLHAEHTIRKQNEKLTRTLEARDKLYSVIAHDLRSPIGTIKMINTAIEHRKDRIQDSGIRKYFDMINETTEEAFNLLENLLRWTRNQNGKTKVCATHFNLSLAIRQVLSLFNTIAETKQIRLQNYVAENLYVYADEDMVKTVLRNLISNAIKFTYPGGGVDVDVTCTPGGILTSVKDNGKGIPAQIQSKLLKTNEYITTTGTRNEKGSGLGLILCRDFIKMNKGKFYFISQEGMGTTFCVLLPSNPPVTSPR